MADALVIDASAAISAVRGEESAAAVRDAIADADPRRLLVPEIFWVEVTNTLVRRHRQPMDRVLDAVAELDGLGLRTVHASRGGLLNSVALMIERGLSGYDATYLALAELVDANLLTLDRRLAAAAGARAVNVGTGEVRESPAPYQLEPWITWDNAASYLRAARRATTEETRST